MSGMDASILEHMRERLHWRDLIVKEALTETYRRPRRDKAA